VSTKTKGNITILYTLIYWYFVGSESSVQKEQISLYYPSAQSTYVCIGPLITLQTYI